MKAGILIPIFTSHMSLGKVTSPLLSFNYNKKRPYLQYLHLTRLLSGLNEIMNVKYLVNFTCYQLLIDQRIPGLMNV